MSEVYENPMGTDGFEFVEYAAPDPQALRSLFERMGFPEDMTKQGSLMYFGDYYMYEFWRFVFVQQVMGKELQTFLEFPPMQRGASFNLDAIKAEMAAKMAEAEKATHGASQ